MDKFDSIKRLIPLSVIPLSGDRFTLRIFIGYGWVDKTRHTNSLIITFTLRITLCCANGTWPFCPNKFCSNKMNQNRICLNKTSQNKTCPIIICSNEISPIKISPNQIYWDRACHLDNGIKLNKSQIPLYIVM
jgi:hypothetical protein